jgi:hypothetical protein
VLLSKKRKRKFLTSVRARNVFEGIDEKISEESRSNEVRQYMQGMKFGERKSYKHWGKDRKDGSGLRLLK